MLVQAYCLRAVRQGKSSEAPHEPQEHSMIVTYQRTAIVLKHATLLEQHVSGYEPRARLTLVDYCARALLHCCMLPCYMLHALYD
jgi:hypothetical protein